MKLRLPRPLAAAALALFAPCGMLQAWDYAGHRLVGQVALASLPADFPGFVRTPANAERIAFLTGEADRWRNVPDVAVRHSGGSWTDHFCDVEYIPEAGLDWATLTPFRYEFVVQFAAGRAAHAHRFRPIDPAKNKDRTAEWPGFAPWAITEHFGRLRSAFSYLRVFEELGTPEEVANAQANVVYLMGVMAHNVGDVAQPLHTTKHYNGWAGDNPRGYTTWNGLHAWIDGGIIERTGLNFAALRPRVPAARPIPLAPRADQRDPMFVAAVDFLLEQHRKVEVIYELEKAGRLGRGEGVAVPEEARALIEEQLLRGGQMLGSIWLTAHRGAVPDNYLRATLIKRAAAPGSPARTNPAP